jgi:hypothetical protein
MKRVLITPVLAAVLFAAACGEDGDSTTGPATGPTADVRFFNATTGMTGSAGFTTNGQFASGSSVASGQSTPSCAKVTVGSTSFGFGAANAGGTALSGNALATLNDQSITAGGNYTVVATGSATSPQLFLLDNNFSGSLGSNQAAVRFVNLAPGAPLPFNVLKGTLGSGPTTVVGTGLAVGAPTTFAAVTSGANAYTVLNGHNTAISGSAATLNLQAGTVSTVAIVRGTAPDSYQLIGIPRCS